MAPEFVAHQGDGVVLCADGVHQRVRVAHDLDGAIALAHEAAADLDAVAAQVDDGAAAGQAMVPEPGRMGAGVGLPGAHPGDVTDGSVLHGLDGLERLGGVDQVLQVAAEDTGLLDRLQHALGLIRGAPQGLGHEHGLAGPRDRADGLLVQEVGQRHDDHVRVRMLDGGLQIRRGLRHAVPLPEGLTSPSGPRVDDTDAILATLPVQGHGVEVADEPRAEHGDVVLLHSFSSFRWCVAPIVSPRSGAGGAPGRPGGGCSRSFRGRPGCGDPDVQAFVSGACTVWTVPAVGRNVDSCPSSQATR